MLLRGIAGLLKKHKKWGIIKQLDEIILKDVLHIYKNLVLFNNSVVSCRTYAYCHLKFEFQQLYETQDTYNTLLTKCPEINQETNAYDIKKTHVIWQFTGLPGLPVACHVTPSSHPSPQPCPPSLVLPLIGYLQHQQLIRCDRSWQVTSQAKIPPGGHHISPNLFWRWTNSKVWLSMKHVELFF